MWTGLDPWWGPSTLWTYKSLTPLGSVHFVDRDLNPWWGPSALWIYKLDPSWVRPLYGSNLLVVKTQHGPNVPP